MGPGQSQIFQTPVGVAIFHNRLKVDLFSPLETEKEEAYRVVSYTEADHCQLLGKLTGYLSQSLCPTSPVYPTPACLCSTPTKGSRMFQLLGSQLAELVISPLCPVKYLSSPLPAGVRFPY